MTAFSTLRMARMLLLAPALYAQQASTTRDPAMEAIALRQAANATRMQSPHLAADMERAHISAQQLEWMRRQLCPLGFLNPRQYQDFRRELEETLRILEMDDVHVGLAGTASAFYSENPRKPVGHFFDENPAEPADLDFNLAGPSILKRMQAAGKKPHPVVPDIFRARDVAEVFPALREFGQKWTHTLHRQVSFVAMTSLQPYRSPLEFVVVKGPK